MATIIPGPTCTTHGAVPPDGGTTCRQSSAPSAPAGTETATAADVPLTPAEAAAILAEGKQMTYEAEGDGTHPYVPDNSSGVTIGHGYDLKEKISATVVGDLQAAKVAVWIGQLLTRGIGLYGATGKAFIAKTPAQVLNVAPAQVPVDMRSVATIADIALTEPQQQALFEVSYRDMKADAIHLATKADARAAYHTTTWAAIHPVIQVILIDLRFRGDSTTTTRRVFMPYVADNDLEGFADVVSDPDNWPNVVAQAIGRFRLRKAFVKKHANAGPIAATSP